MKVSELIEKLQQLPQDAVVVVMDSERSAYEASGDPSPEGLYYDFEVDLDSEMFFKFDRESVEDNPIPTVVISFESDYIEKQAEIKELDATVKGFEEQIAKCNDLLVKSCIMLRSVFLSFTVHPDNEPNSEFRDKADGCIGLAGEIDIYFTDCLPVQGVFVNPDGESSELPSGGISVGKHDSDKFIFPKKAQECYKSGADCVHNCPGLCRENC